VSAIPPSTAADAAPLGRTAEPAWVRRGSAAVQQEYREAQAFEQMLTQQLTSTMSEAGGLGQEAAGGEGEEAGSGAASGLGPLAALLPQALAGGLSQAGGLGLAAQLTREQLALGDHAATTRAAGGSLDGGTSAPASGGSA